MARKRAIVSIPASTKSGVAIYAEGTYDYLYLDGLVKLDIIEPYSRGAKLMATQVSLRIESIKRDMCNDAIDKVIWLVDGGDEHIKNSKDFKEFYMQWCEKKYEEEDNEWKKLIILINQPCLEYWLLLHLADPPTDKEGIPICFSDANDLYSNEIFQENFPDFNKNDSRYMGNLITSLANNKYAREQAKNRANDLPDLQEEVNKNNILTIARAEVHQIIKLGN